MTAGNLTSGTRPSRRRKRGSATDCWMTTLNGHSSPFQLDVPGLPTHDSLARGGAQGCQSREGGGRGSGVAPELRGLVSDHDGGPIVDLDSGQVVPRRGAITRPERPGRRMLVAVLIAKGCPRE